MNPSNGLCQDCSQKSPSVFCQCSAPEVLLCLDCIGKHIVRSPGKDHVTRPISELAYYKIPGYFERFKTRIAALPRVKEEMMKSVGEVDRALGEYAAAMERVIAEFTGEVDKEVREMRQRIEEVIAKSNSAISELRRKGELEVQRLSNLKGDLTREVQAALEEVERTLVEDKPQLTAHYSPLFRQLTEAFEPFQLFSFSINTSQQPDITLSTHLQVSLPSYPTGAIELAQVTSTFLRFFLCCSSSWGPQISLLTPIQADVSSVWVVLKDGRLFCCGGEENSSITLRIAYFLGRDGVVEKVPDMLNARKNHGVIEIIHIYVFGGVSYLRKCEKITVDNGVWMALPDMKEGKCWLNLVA